MRASPITPGVYRVRGSGLDLTVRASHPCDAICIALDILAAKAAA